MTAGVVTLEALESSEAGIASAGVGRQVDVTRSGAGSPWPPGAQEWDIARFPPSSGLLFVRLARDADPTGEWRECLDGSFPLEQKDASGPASATPAPAPPGTGSFVLRGGGSSMLSTAMPWTYWMALPLVVSSALALLGFAAAYLKKVVAPDLQRRDALAVAKLYPWLASGRDRRALGAVRAGEHHENRAAVPRAPVATRSG